jgi:hypothetical protein
VPGDGGVTVKLLVSLAGRLRRWRDPGESRSLVTCGLRLAYQCGQPGKQEGREHGYLFDLSWSENRRRPEGFRPARHPSALELR